MTEIVNVSPPGDEWNDKVQRYAIELTDMRHKIDQGNTSLVPEYKLMLTSGVRMLQINIDETLKNLIEETKQTKGIFRSLNPLTGDYSYRQSEGYIDYMEKLSKIHNIVMKKIEVQNYLHKTVEKRRPLS